MELKKYEQKKIVFSIFLVLLTGAMMMSFLRSTLVFGQNIPTFSLPVKITFLICFAMYLFLFYVSIKSVYFLLLKNEYSPFFFLMALMYSFVIEINSATFYFIPIGFKYTLIWNVGLNEKIGFGLNFVGLLFFVYLSKLKKDNKKMHVTGREHAVI